MDGSVHERAQVRRPAGGVSWGELLPEELEHDLPHLVADSQGVAVDVLRQHRLDHLGRRHVPHHRRHLGHLGLERGVVTAVPGHDQIHTHSSSVGSTSSVRHISATDQGDSGSVFSSAMNEYTAVTR